MFPVLHGLWYLGPALLLAWAHSQGSWILILHTGCRQTFTHEVFFVTLLWAASSFLISCLTNSRDHVYSKLGLYPFCSAEHALDSTSLSFCWCPQAENWRCGALGVSLLPSIVVLRRLLPSARNRYRRYLWLFSVKGQLSTSQLCRARSGCPLLHALVQSVHLNKILNKRSLSYFSRKDIYFISMSGPCSRWLLCTI